MVRRADSRSQDALLIVNKGWVKPQIPITLVMGVESLTGRRKVLTVVNRFRHAINDHCAEQLETELLFHIIQYILVENAHWELNRIVS